MEVDDRMRQHRDVDPASQCGGWVAEARKMFNLDYWCVYCGASDIAAIMGVSPAELFTKKGTKRVLRVKASKE